LARVDPVFVLVTEPARAYPPGRINNDDGQAQEHAALHWAKDGHCTAEGHRIIAETIYEALIRTGAVVLASDKSKFSDFRAVAPSRK